MTLSRKCLACLSRTGHDSSVQSALVAALQPLGFTICGECGIAFHPWSREFVTIPGLTYAIGGAVRYYGNRIVYLMVYTGTCHHGLEMLYRLGVPDDQGVVCYERDGYLGVRWAVC